MVEAAPEDKGLKYNWYKMAHFLSEAFAAHDFTGGELRVLQLVCRETYGRTISRDNPRKKEFSSMPQSQISERTGLPESSVRRLISTLVKKNVLLRKTPKDPSAPWPIGVNTRIKQWEVTCEGVIWEKEFPMEWTSEGDQELTGGSGTDGGAHTGSPIPSIGDQGLTGGGSGLDGGISRNPNNGNGLRSPKEPCIKEPLSEREPNEVLGSEPPVPRANLESAAEARQLARDMLKNFKDEWWANSIAAPPLVLTDCQNFVEAYAHELEAAWEEFDKAYTGTVEWQEQTGKRVGKPTERVFDYAIAGMRKRGIEPLARGEPHWVEG